MGVVLARLAMIWAWPVGVAGVLELVFKKLETMEEGLDSLIEMAIETQIQSSGRLPAQPCICTCCRSQIKMATGFKFCFCLVDLSNLSSIGGGKLPPPPPPPKFSVIKG